MLPGQGCSVLAVCMWLGKEMKKKKKKKKKKKTPKVLSSFDLKILFLKFNVIKFKEQSLAYMNRPVVLKISTWHICVNRHLSLDITWQKKKKKKKNATISKY